MTITRRELLQRATAIASATILLPLTQACESGDGSGLPAYSWTGPFGEEALFRFGVASGDPTHSSVILWARPDLPEGAGELVPAFFEVATDEGFADRVAAAPVDTLKSDGYTVKVDVTGLEAGTEYFYRFYCLGRVSPVGRTRTLPNGSVDTAKFGVVSCSNYAFGFFHAYRHLANQDDLDAVLHLGDYIYEYASPGHGETYGTYRELDPLTETRDYDDYNKRYAQYRLDADLQAVHQKFPMIHVWDDHEFTNDPKLGGAENHQPDEDGDWEQRKADALRAYSQWMPTRLGPEGRIYRSFEFGDLVKLVMLDRQRRFLFPGPDDAGEYLGAEQSQFMDGEIATTTQQWLTLGVGTRFAPRDANMTTGASWGAEDRQRVLNGVNDAQISNLVVLIGDIHRFEALDIVSDPETYEPTTGRGSGGVEFACGSVTSFGSNVLSDAPQFHWNDGFNRGFLTVEYSADRVVGEFWGFPLLHVVETELPELQLLSSWESPHGRNALTRTDA